MIKRTYGFLALCAFAVIFAGCSAFYTQASIVPSAANMQADCTAHPGSNSCDVLAVLTGVCNGQVTLPIEFGNINQDVCIALGYRTSPAGALKVEKPL
jgi:hypothetical protein